MFEGSKQAPKQSTGVRKLREEVATGGRRALCTAMRVLSAVIFDIDGTLIDSVDLHAQAWQRAFSHFGKQVDFGAVRSQIGKGGDKLLPVFLSESELAAIGEELEQYRSTLFRREYLPQVRPFPDVRPLFERLLDAQTSADDAERSKPDPDIFEAALEQLGSPPLSSVLVVGDTPYDAEAAGKAGLKTVGVLCGGFAPELLNRAGCIALYRDPSELLRRFDSSPLCSTSISPENKLPKRHVEEPDKIDGRCHWNRGGRANRVNRGEVRST